MTLPNDPPTEALRATLDALDSALLDVLAARRRAVLALFRHKRAHGLPLVDPAREAALLAARAEAGRVRDLPPALVAAVFAAVLDASHADAATEPSPPPRG